MASQPVIGQLLNLTNIHFVIARDLHFAIQFKRTYPFVIRKLADGVGCCFSIWAQRYSGGDKKRKESCVGDGAVAFWMLSRPQIKS